MRCAATSDESHMRDGTGPLIKRPPGGTTILFELSTVLHLLCLGSAVLPERKQHLLESRVSRTGRSVAVAQLALPTP